MKAASRSLAARPSLGPLALFVLALLASACSARRAAGHGRHGVASLGSTTTTHASTSQASGSGNITTANYRAAFGVRRLHALARRAELPGPEQQGRAERQFPDRWEGWVARVEWRQPELTAVPTNALWLSPCSAR